MVAAKAAWAKKSFQTRKSYKFNKLLSKLDPDNRIETGPIGAKKPPG
jgi:hypothetical protein